MRRNRRQRKDAGYSRCTCRSHSRILMTRTGIAGSTRTWRPGACRPRRSWSGGGPAGPELVRAVMAELGLEPCQPRPWRISLTEGDGQEHDIPDLVARDFTAGAPGEKMVGDITYISTWEGWLFL